MKIKRSIAIILATVLAFGMTYSDLSSLSSVSAATAVSSVPDGVSAAPAAVSNPATASRRASVSDIDLAGSFVSDNSPSSPDLPGTMPVPSLYDTGFNENLKDRQNQFNEFPRQDLAALEAG